MSASGGMRGRKGWGGGGGSHFTWPLCIRRRRGKQAKVTSGRQVSSAVAGLSTSCGGGSSGWLMQTQKKGSAHPIPCALA